MLKPGTIIEKYEILEPLAGGSMGLVYRVRHTARLTEHALRTLDPKFAIDLGIRESFKESNLKRIQLYHPNIVSVQDVVEADGVIGVVSELVRGPSLAEVLGHRGGQQYSLEECLNIVGPITEALAAAHERGHVHRGLQPDRIILEQPKDAQGALIPKLIDFDVPGVLCRGKQIQQSPANFGAAPYMAPELARGELDVDSRSDVFALGMLMWRMLSGRLPVNPMDLVSVMRVYTGEAVIPSLSESRPSLPASFRELVDRCLTIEPEVRPKDGLELKVMLSGLKPERRVVAEPPPKLTETHDDLEYEVIAEDEIYRSPTPPPIPLDYRPNQAGLPPITERESAGFPGTVARTNGPTRIEEPTAFYRARSPHNSSIFGTAAHHITEKRTVWALLGGVVLMLIAFGGWNSQSTANQLPLKPLAVAQRATMTATVSASEAKVEVQPSKKEEPETETDEEEIEVAQALEPKPIEWRKNKGPCKQLIGSWEGTRRHFRVEGSFTEKGRKCNAEMKLYDGDRFVGVNQYRVSMNDMHLMEGRGKTRLKAHRDNVTGDVNCWFSIRPRSRSRYLGRGCGGRFDIRRVQ